MDAYCYIHRASFLPSCCSSILSSITPKLFFLLVEKVAKVLGFFVHPCPGLPKWLIIRQWWSQFDSISFTLIFSSVPIYLLGLFKIDLLALAVFWALMCQSTCSSAYLLQRRNFQWWSWLPSKVPFLQMSPVAHFPDFHLEIWNSRSKSLVQFSNSWVQQSLNCSNWSFALQEIGEMSPLFWAQTDTVMHVPPTYCNSQMLVAVYAFQMFVSKLQHTEITHMRLDTDLSLKINPGFVSAH